MEVTVRRGTGHDRAAVLALDRATWSPRVSPGPPPSTSGAPAGDREVLVAEHDRRVVGYLALAPATTLASNAHVRAIVGLAVDPAYQGAGVGRRLLDAAAAHARAIGVTKLSLRVLAPNGRARRFYEAGGFVVEGVLRDEFRIDGTVVSDVLMARHLPPPG